MLKHRPRGESKSERLKREAEESCGLVEYSSGHQHSVPLKFEETEEEVEETVERARGEDDKGGDDNSKVLASLEKAFNALEYDLDQCLAALRSVPFPQEVLSWVLKDTGLTESKVMPVLRAQVPKLLGHYETLMQQKLQLEAELKAAQEEAQRQEILRKIEERKAIQQKLKYMGRCPMGFDWIDIGGGYQCAGGSHYMSNAELGLN